MVVFTAGCFDVVHVGHINLLLFCRQLAGPNGKVHVCIDTDEKIKKEKGSYRPIFDETERWNQIFELKFGGGRIADYIHKHESNEELHGKVFLAKPDYIVVGDSYQGKPVIGAEYATVVYFKQNDKFSSTNIIQSILKKELR